MQASFYKPKYANTPPPHRDPTPPQIYVHVYFIKF